MRNAADRDVLAKWSESNLKTFVRRFERIPLDWNQLRRVGVLHRSFWLGWFELSVICFERVKPVACGRLGGAPV